MAECNVEFVPYFCPPCTLSLCTTSRATWKQDKKKKNLQKQFWDFFKGRSPRSGHGHLPTPLQNRSFYCAASQKWIIADTPLLSFGEITPLLALPWRFENYREFRLRATCVRFCSQRHPQFSFHLQSEAGGSGGRCSLLIAGVLVFILSSRWPLNIQ